MSEEGPPTPDPNYGYYTPPPQQAPPGYPPHLGHGAPPGYGPPPPGYPPQPGWMPGYPAYGYGYYADGPPGRMRSTGVTILLFVCTFGIYYFIYNYSVHDEMRRHSGRGVGGGIALLLTFLAPVAMPFVTPAEVGSMYTRKNQPPPVSGWTGLWSAIPVIGGYIFQFIFFFASFSTFDGSDHGDRFFAGFLAYFVIWFGAIIAGNVIWFVKTNDALNRYWGSVGVPPR